MGILYKSVKSVDAFKQKKKENILEALLALGVTETKDGISVHKLDYGALRDELVLASFRQN